MRQKSYDPNIINELMNQDITSTNPLSQKPTLLPLSFCPPGRAPNIVAEPGSRGKPPADAVQLANKHRPK